jgi:hypothetical protein
MDEGFAAFLPTLAGQTILGKSTSIYGGFFDLEWPTKAWGARLGRRSGKRYSLEDLAVAALFWDLVDPESHTESNQVIGQDESLHPVTYSYSASTPIRDLWNQLVQFNPYTVYELRGSFDIPDPTVDLDGLGTPDVAPLDEVFLMHGFFPIIAQQNAPIPGTTYHYDVAAAQRDDPSAARDANVSLSSHVGFNASGTVIQSFPNRHQTPTAESANLALHVQDTSGTPLSGAAIDLTVQYPGQSPQTITRSLASGDGVPVHLELPPYFDYLLPDDAPLPPCDPANDVQITVQVTAKLNGYVSADAPSFDNCTYQQAIDAATGPSALSFTMTFPEDSSTPTTTAYTLASQPPVNGVTDGFWTVEFSCSDPVVSDFASGCYRTEYRIDGGGLVPYEDRFVIADAGQHTIEFHSVDSAGNAEAFQSITVAVALDTDEDGLSDVREAALGTDPNNPDTDGDGLLDGDEVTRGTSPFDTDSDHDGLTDSAEVTRGTDPLIADTDGDGLNDGAEVALGTNPLAADTDGDGLDDGAEVARGTNPFVADTDADALSDGAEVNTYGTNPLVADTDGDGLNDGAEIQRGTNPFDTDSDDDGLLDGDEVARGTNPLSSDTDGDALPDAFEVGLGTNPIASDSDGDGLSDGAEFGADTSPLVADSDGDGVADGADNCVLRANPGQQNGDGDALGDVCDADKDNDGIPDGYTSWQLVGITGDGASTPDTLYALNQTNASATFLMTLGNGDDGEAIGFDPLDGRLHHASGARHPVWESIDLATRTLVTSVPQVVAVPPGYIPGEVQALEYDLATGRFLASARGAELDVVSPTGSRARIGDLPTSLKGLAFAGGALYGAENFAGYLFQLDPATGSEISEVPVKLFGDYTDGMNGLATDPRTGVLWGIVRYYGDRYLATIDPATGVASSVGLLSDNFAGIAFLPEPSTVASLTAGAIAVALCAASRRRRERRSA